jgi:RimJ/RimL family protein N-acetyltransferase
VLRRFVPEDREGFVEMNRDPGVRKYFPGLLTPEESLGEVTRIEQHWDTHGFGPWALDVRGDFAGILGLKWVPPDMPFAPAVELLYRLIPRFWGQGLATEGSLAALEFGFCELHLDKGRSAQQKPSRHTSERKEPDCSSIRPRLVDS